MADFLTDYSNLAGAGSAFQGFAEGFQNAQDSKMKRQEMQAKMDAMKQEQDRAATEQALKLRLADTQKNPMTGQLEDRPPSLQETNKQAIALGEKGINAPQYDDHGKVKPLTWNPGSAPMIGAQAKATTAAAALSPNNAKNVRNELAANKQYSQEMGPIEKQLLGSNKIMSLVNKISAKDLQSTPQLRSDLSAGLGSLINQGQPATVYSMSHQDFDSAYGRMKGALQFLTAGTGDSMSDQQLNQLKKDVQAIQNEFSTQHQTKFDSFKEGMPDQFVPKLDKRFNSFRKGAGISGEQSPEQSAPPQGMVPQQKGMLSGLVDRMVPAPPAQAKPQTVIQNGHTYTLNPKTGQYE